MPRGRPRKPRLSRMDAAVDAMVPFGFSEEKVREVVKVLLKEYGGDEGWPFIEEYSYKELIEAILRDVEGHDQEKVAEDGNQSKDKSFEDERAAETSSKVSETQQDERPEDNSLADAAKSCGAVGEPTCSEVVSSSSGINTAEGDGKGWKDILPDQTSGLVEEIANVGPENKDPGSEVHSPGNMQIPALPSQNHIPSPPPTSSLPTRRRLPCYGWIESDEEDPYDFIYLTPATAVLGSKATLPPERKRKSRWDEAPYAP